MNNLETRPIVLTIAGSDSSAGAGVQADLKTISAMGGYAVNVVTSIIAQNTQEIVQISYLEPQVVRSQYEAIVADLPPKAIKIGMLGTSEMVRCIIDLLSKTSLVPIVLDPVLHSIFGKPLLDAQGVDLMMRELVPLVCLVTPNLEESSYLLGDEIKSGQQSEAAKALYRKYGKAFLVKGSYTDECVARDVLYDGVRTYTFTRPYIQTSNIHGAGCTLSSAIACCLAKGMPLHKAVGAAKEYLYGVLLRSRDWEIGNGYGPMWHFVT